jgi:hypothetical protein
MRFGTGLGALNRYRDRCSFGLLWQRWPTGLVFSGHEIYPAILHTVPDGEDWFLIGPTHSGYCMCGYHHYFRPEVRLMAVQRDEAGWKASGRVYYCPS